MFLKKWRIIAFKRARKMGGLDHVTYKLNTHKILKEKPDWNGAQTTME
jgi:hypothetical protein